MATWSLSKAGILRQIEMLVRRMTGQSVLTSIESTTISNAFNEAIVDISSERSITGSPFLRTDTTVTTTASQNYTDMSAGIVTVVHDTVRIAAEDQMLERIELSDFYALDPGEDATGLPSFYTIDYSGTAMRILWRVTPDAAYTVGMNVITIPDEDSISSFPGWMHGMLRALATALSLENLGLNSVIHRTQYEEKLRNARELQRGYTGPVHIAMRAPAASPYRASELRRPT